MKIFYINPIDLKKTGKTAEEIQNELGVSVIVSSNIQQGKLIGMNEKELKFDPFIRENRELRRRK